MNILIINYYHWPAAGAHAFRWSALSKHFAKQGHNVFVITSPVRGAPQLDVSPNLTITRCGLVRLEQSLITDFRPSDNRVIAIFKPIKNLIRRIYRMFYWPDALWHWLPFALRQLYRYRNQNFDFVVSYYPSFGAHIAGFIQKYFFSKENTTWILDYGDPFSLSYDWQPNNYFLYKYLNFFAEKLFFKYGTPVFTNNQTRDEYTRTLGINAGFVIPNMVDINLFYISKAKIYNKSIDTITLTYLGAFYRDVREPFQLLKLLEKLNSLSSIEFKLKIYGPDHGFDLSTTSYPFVKYYGSISREEAFAVMQNSQILVNVENRNCLMTPSKVVECIATGLPILNIVNGEPQHKPKDKYCEIGYLVNAHGNEVGKKLQILLRELIRLASLDRANIDQVKWVLAGNYILEDCASTYLSFVKGQQRFD